MLYLRFLAHSVSSASTLPTSASNLPSNERTGTILDMSNHRMGKIPKIEHKAIHTTLKGFLIQLANYIIARKGADIRLKKSKRQINRTKNFITLKV